MYGHLAVPLFLQLFKLFGICGVPPGLDDLFNSNIGTIAIKLGHVSSSRAAAGPKTYFENRTEPVSFMDGHLNHLSKRASLSSFDVSHDGENITRLKGQLGVFVCEDWSQNSPLIFAKVTDHDTVPGGVEPSLLINESRAFVKLDGQAAVGNFSSPKPQHRFNQLQIILGDTAEEGNDEELLCTVLLGEYELDGLLQVLLFVRWTFELFSHRFLSD